MPANLLSSRYLLSLLLSLLPACSPTHPQPSKEVTLYTSADAVYARPIIDLFEQRTGITVRTVGDTEATKTTGLVQRLIAEGRGGNPRADVWWSSEPFGTIRLARADLLAPYTSDSAEASIRAAGLDGWPTHLRAADLTWYGFALRARVTVFNTDRAHPSTLTNPPTLADLTDPRFKGRIGIARPQFGTTRGHMAALLHAHGEPAFRAWLAALKANGVRLYDGNMSVVRAVAQGEITLGLTDTDDVWSGQRNTWPVDALYVLNTFAQGSSPAPSRGGERATGSPAALSGQPVLSHGPLLIPNTVALINNAPNPDHARRLIDFLLSPEVERLLAESDSHNIPVNPTVAADFPRYALPAANLPDLEAITDATDAAMRICDDVLGQ